MNREILFRGQICTSFAEVYGTITKEGGKVKMQTHDGYEYYLSPSSVKELTVEYINAELKKEMDYEREYVTNKDITDEMLKKSVRRSIELENVLEILENKAVD